MLIVIDGSDGSGKKTQADLLRARLERDGKKVAFFDFPKYDSFYGKMVAKYLRGEFGSLEDVSPYFASMLYALDRLMQRDAMDAALSRGEIVLCNRYVQSNMAYQGVRVPKEKREEFLSWLEDMEFSQHKLPRADLVIFLDVPPEIGQKLVDGKGKRDYVEGRDMHEKNSDYLRSVHAMYGKLAKEKEWKVVHCVHEGKILPRDEISQKIWRLIPSL